MRCTMAAYFVPSVNAYDVWLFKRLNFISGRSILTTEGCAITVRTSTERQLPPTSPDRFFDCLLQ